MRRTAVLAIPIGISIALCSPTLVVITTCFAYAYIVSRFRA